MLYLVADILLGNQMVSPRIKQVYRRWYVHHIWHLAMSGEAFITCAKYKRACLSGRLNSPYDCSRLTFDRPTCRTPLHYTNMSTMSHDKWTAAGCLHIAADRWLSAGR